MTITGPGWTLLLLLRPHRKATPLEFVIQFSSLWPQLHDRFPCLLERLGQFEDLDGEFLATVCEEFYESKNLDDNQGRSMVGVFRSAAAHHEVYRGVLSRLEKDT